ncbi:UNKNOWN [Stylonychia lemnae]|uniref:Transmembrane protein n=1 Tax=Stylonychia lemnae TaxID=5949 RepID=A0A077ZUI5_STYLE|nr:UNKNOWN [Stylonychia lemnae]|eukprot:CDW73537.1 UNKNOWN [Stylonychia lemnae]
MRSAFLISAMSLLYAFIQPTIGQQLRCDEGQFLDKSSSMCLLYNVFNLVERENSKTKLTFKEFLSNFVEHYEILIKENTTATLYTQGVVQVIDSINLIIRSYSTDDDSQNGIYAFLDVHCLKSYHQNNSTLYSLMSEQNYEFLEVTEQYINYYGEMYSKINQTEYETIIDFQRSVFYLIRSNITIQNLIINRDKYQTISEPMILINTINNVTIDRSTFSTYTKLGDPNINILMIDTAEKCIVKDKDDRKLRILQFSNNYITTNVSNTNNVISLFSIAINQNGDSQRPFIQIIENITAENVITHSDFFRIGSFLPELTLSNFYFNNVLLNTQQTFGVNATINGILNIKMDHLQNSQTAIKHSTAPLNAISQFKNLHFMNNSLFQNAAFQMDRSYSMRPSQTLKLHNKIGCSRNLLRYSKLFSKKYNNALIKVQSNSELSITNSNFVENFSNSRGSIILGDFQNTVSYIRNTTFIRNYAYEGGVFYTWFGSSLQFYNCTFYQNFAFRGGIGSVLNQDQPSSFINSMIQSNDLVSFQEAKEKLNLDQAFITSIEERYPNIYQLSSTKSYSKLYISNSTIKQCKIDSYLGIMFLDASYAQIDSLSYYDNELNSQRIIQILRSDFFQISKSSFDQIDTKLIEGTASTISIVFTNVTGLKTFRIDKIYSDFIAIKGDNCIVSIYQSQFSNLKSEIFGGVIQMLQGRLETRQSIFSFNTAQSASICNYTIANSTFVQNVATLQGGVLYYNKFRPLSLETNIYIDNIAPYGPQFASYPFSVQIKEQYFSSVASGQINSGYILAEIIDPDGQVLKNDNENVIQITEIEGDSTSVVGLRELKVQNGQSNFTNLTFIATPGSYHVPFMIYSPKCEPGYFSLQYNQEECFECPDHSDCLGGYQISVNPGHWRSNFNSTKVLNCLNEKACKGGLYKLNDTNYNALCSFGYGGNLCDKCYPQNGTIYSRSFSNDCEPCPDPIRNTIIIVLISLGILLYLLLLIVMNIKVNNHHKETSVVLKIMTNFLQVLTTTSSLRLEWPPAMISFYEIFSQVGQSTENLLSIDCFLKESIPVNSANSLIYFKTLVVGFMPILAFLFYFALMFIYKKIRQTKKQQLKRWLIISGIMVIYFLHPTITKYAVGIFFCIELENGEYWLSSDLEVFH